MISYHQKDSLIQNPQDRARNSYALEGERRMSGYPDYI